MPTTALLIVNPNSRMGCEADLKDAIELLEAAGIGVIQTTSQSSSDTVAQIEANRQNIDLVILAGGDGTISSAASALYRHQLPFAIFPLGTANDLARSLGIPADLLQASRTIIDNYHRKVDLGVVNGHHFFNVANIGLGVDVTHELTPEVKRTWGILSYLKALNSALARRKTFHATIITDGHSERVSSIHLGVGNGRYYGGGNIIDENASIDSGRLCLYSLKPQSVLGLLKLAPLMRGGMQSRLKQTYSSSGCRIEVRTYPNLEVDADGEPVTRTPAVFEVIPAALEVCAPKEYCPNESAPEKT